MATDDTGVSSVSGFVELTSASRSTSMATNAGDVAGEK
jgi:hypothetical protein